MVMPILNDNRQTVTPTPLRMIAKRLSASYSQPEPADKGDAIIAIGLMIEASQAHEKDMRHRRQLRQLRENLRIMQDDIRRARQIAVQRRDAHVPQPS